MWQHNSKNTKIENATKNEPEKVREDKRKFSPYLYRENKALKVMSGRGKGNATRHISELTDMEPTGKGYKSSSSILQIR